MDIAPVNSGHLMVVPRRHAAGLADLDEETGAHMFVVAMRLGAAVRESGVRCEGVNLFLADGVAAFQDVFHVHLHVLPRWGGDSFRIDADWSSRPERAELDAVAGSIRSRVRPLGPSS
jgi:histidine triad (HIT) family protein